MDLLSYNSFSSVKSFESLLLEAKIQYLNDFERALGLMSSPVAKEILSLKDQDVNVQTNFVNTTDKEDVISFIPDNKSKKRDIYILKDRYKSFTQTVVITYFGLDPTQQYYIPREGTEGIILKSSDNESLSKHLNQTLKPNFETIHLFKSLSDGKVCPMGESGLEKTDKQISIPDEDEKRQELKVGRFASRILNAVGKKFSDKELEEFVNEFKSKIAIINDVFGNFELVKGEDIRFWYLATNYDNSKSSTLHQSCMRYNTCQEFFGIYEENSCCQLLILRSKNDFNKISGRALIWKLSDGTTFMDRIYYSVDSEVELFKEYAKKNGWCYKKAQQSSADTQIEFDPKTPYTKSLIVSLDKYDFEYYPYLDTLKYLDGQTLSTTQSHNSKVLEDTDGGVVEACERCDGENEIECEDCDGNGQIHCSECSGDGTVPCGDCEDGKNPCSQCDGEGEVDGEECDKCKGEGDIECEECSGEGTIGCAHCDGEGEYECGECYGSGNVDCPECC